MESGLGCTSKVGENGQAAGLFGAAGRAEVEEGERDGALLGGSQVRSCI